MVSNGDIGFVRAGQQAEVKVDTFNFTRYGLLRGEMLSVSSDAVIRDRKQDRANDRGLGTESETSEPKGQELNYSARISLDRAAMQIDDRMVKLAPGMAVTVEIKTGSRSIFSPGRPTRGTSVTASMPARIVRIKAIHSASTAAASTTHPGAPWPSIQPHPLGGEQAGALAGRFGEGLRAGARVSSCDRRGAFMRKAIWVGGPG